MAQNEQKLTNPWFEHDENASSDGKILKMFSDFRRLSREMSQAELQSFVSLGAYGIYWRIIEFMHGEQLSVDDVEMIADDLRVDSKFVEMILNSKLFHVEDGFYISDRVQDNLRRRKEKSSKGKSAVTLRWLLSAFNAAYQEFFFEEPILESSEIEALKKYSIKIPDLKDKFRDILYTLSQLKFDNDINFKPCANWLLSKNNLARLVNGEFGSLKHKPTAAELKAKQKAQQEEEQRQKQEIEETLSELAAINTREEAIGFLKLKPKSQLVFNPNFKKLMQKWEISKDEVITNGI